MAGSYTEFSIPGKYVSKVDTTKIAKINTNQINELWSMLKFTPANDSNPKAMQKSNKTRFFTEYEA